MRGKKAIKPSPTPNTGDGKYIIIPENGVAGVSPSYGVFMIVAGVAFIEFVTRISFQ